MAALSAKLACDASQLGGGRSKFARCPLKFAPHSTRCSAAACSASVEMPGGVFWLDKASHSSDVVYGEVRKALSMPDVMLSVGLLRQTKDNRAGYNEPLACHIVDWGALMLLYICNPDLPLGTLLQNFVLQRPRRGGPGLVLSPKLQAMEVAQQLNAQCTAPAGELHAALSCTIPTSLKGFHRLPCACPETFL